MNRGTSFGRSVFISPLNNDKNPEERLGKYYTSWTLSYIYPTYLNLIITSVYNLAGSNFKD